MPKRLQKASSERIQRDSSRKSSSVIGSFLRNAREKRGLSQGDVAQKLGLGSPQSISDWERGYGSGVPLNTLLKLIKLYRIEAVKTYEIFVEDYLLRVRQKLDRKFRTLLRTQRSA